MDTLGRFRLPSKRWSCRLLVCAAFLSEIGWAQQPTPTAPTATASPSAMKTFVIIFRQSPQSLTDADKQRRAEETAVWARRQNAAGHKLDPHILAPENAHRGSQNSAANQSDAWPITALLFLLAQDLNEAAQIAESHPALRYGASVEIRPWSAPVPTPAQTSATP
jgi:hypothetical protein